MGMEGRIKRMSEELRCIGCGAPIQTEQPKELGYTPKSSLLKAEAEESELYCQRCFRLRHYNEIQDVSLSDDDFLKLLNDIRQKEALIINVVDIFDFNGSIIPGLHRFIGDNELLLVGNKRDLLPKSLKEGKLTQWMKERAHEIGLRPEEVLLISAKKKADIQKLLEKIEQYRKGRDVYIVGVTNVGKSTLINAIIQQVAGVQSLITTSQFPGTTLDLIEIPLDDGHYIVDTPGIIHRHQMAHYIGPKSLKMITPKKEIKPKTYQLNAGQTLFLSGLARFDFLEGKKASITVYTARDLYLHRTKLEKAATFYERQVGNLLVPPTKEESKQLPKLQRYEFTTKEKTDIVFSGLGWVTVPAHCTLAAWAPEGVAVVLRKALI